MMPSGKPFTKSTMSGSALALVLHNRELVDREPVVVLRIFEVDDLGLGTADAPVVGAVLDGHSVDEHSVKRAVSASPGSTRREELFCGKRLPEPSAGMVGFSLTMDSRTRRASLLSPYPDRSALGISGATSGP